MRIAVTGTPGTGKTTATDLLAGGDGDLVPGSVEVIHLNDVIRKEGLSEGTDPERDSVVADLDAIETWLDRNAGNRSSGTDTTDDTDTTTIVESHLAHHLQADRVAVLRCHPETLEARLEDRGEPPATVEENAESEALDVVLGEAVEGHGIESVHEIDTTDRAPDAVAEDLAAVVTGEREPSAGVVSFAEYLR